MSLAAPRRELALLPEPAIRNEGRRLRNWRNMLKLLMGGGMRGLFGAARHILALLAVGLVVASCGGGPTLPPATSVSQSPSPDYIIGPLDSVNIFVWRNPELSQTVPVRPDGRISIPLIEDLQAAGKTPTQLARDIEAKLKKYVQDPIVTVIVTNFNGPYSRQVRVIGEAAHPQAIPYREHMTLLDVMIAVGGLTQYAAGDRATIVRMVHGKETIYDVRVADLVKDGDVSANVQMLPGDILIIPQSWF
jgi:polysaccharide biosynthesis/export protein